MLLSSLPSPLHLVLASYSLLQVARSSPIGLAAHLESNHDALLVERQADPFFVIRGVQTGNVQARLEIRELQKNADQWNIYVLGLSRMQSTVQDTKLSYYQISGIHGVPYIPWDNVPQADGGYGGYCAHSSNVFLPWHRPYLALFEEILYEHCNDAVQEFPEGPDRDKYAAALANFRMPYWDWAIAPAPGEGVLPTSMAIPEIDVILPNGTARISNPLFSYNFHPLNVNDFSSGDAAKQSFPSTMRHPTTLDASASSNNDGVNIDLNNARSGHQSRLYHIFSQVTTFDAVSNDASPDDSIESVHGNVHVIVGGDGGHMTDVPFSSFDPSFWLHHTMIDRVFALWQALYPETYVSLQQQQYGTFAWPQGATLDADSALAPFHSDANGAFWTSNSARSPTAFGYTYPELVSGNRDELVAAVNALYSPPPARASKRSLLDGDAADVVSQYFANIKVEKFGLDGSFSVVLFFGEPTTEPAAWLRDPNFVGFDSTFAPKANNARGRRLQTTGVVPLTLALEERVAKGELPDLEEATVAAYLKKNLRWRVRKPDSTEVPLDQVPDLRVAALSRKVRPATSIHEFPKALSDYNILTDVTNGLLGGFGLGDIL